MPLSPIETLIVSPSLRPISSLIGSGIVIVRELSKASGVWNLRSQFAKIKSGTWADSTRFLNTDLDYLIVAGGGGGGCGGGGGAGGNGSAGTCTGGGGGSGVVIIRYKFQ